MAAMRIADGIHRLGSGLVNSYLLVDGTAVTIVDAGLPGQWNDLLAELERDRAQPRRRPGAGPDPRPLGPHRLRRAGAHGAGDPGVGPRARRRARARRGRPTRPRAAARSGRCRCCGSCCSASARARSGTKNLGAVGTFGDGATLDVPGAPRVVLVPGHTPGSAALVVEPRVGRVRRRRVRDRRRHQRRDGTDDRAVQRRSRPGARVARSAARPRRRAGPARPRSTVDRWPRRGRAADPGRRTRCDGPPRRVTADDRRSRPGAWQRRHRPSPDPARRPHRGLDRIGERRRATRPPRPGHAGLAAVDPCRSDAMVRAGAAGHHHRAAGLRRVDPARGPRLRRARGRHDRDPRLARHRCAAGLRRERRQPAHPRAGRPAPRSGHGGDDHRRRGAARPG